MNANKKLITLGGLLFLLGSAVAQENPVGCALTNAPFEEFVKSIERQTNFHFYYDRRHTDSLSITITAASKPLASVLRQALQGTGFDFSFFEKSIFISKNRTIYTELPVGFFDKGNAPTNNQPFDYTDYLQKEKSRRAEEMVYAIGTFTRDLTGEATLTGSVRDIQSGQAIIGAAVVEEKTGKGVVTDPLGGFTIVLPKGRHLLKIKSIGMKTTTRNVVLYSNGKLNIELEEVITPLKEVVVNSSRESTVLDTQMGVQKMDIKEMKQIPLSLGETDVLKVVTMLPGVQTVGEGTLGLNVRGGTASQNLILFNDAIVYNPSHFFGFFSTFNPDVVKSVELYKSGVTADYGGRLASVLEVQAREGNYKKLAGSGGISPVSARLTLEGPITDKTVFMIGARTTYSDWVLHQINDPSLKNTQASFYDVDASINHKINANNQIALSGYISKDHFRLNSDTAYQYSNQSATVKWRHVFNPKLFSSLIASYSGYNFEVASDKNPKTAFAMDYSIRQFNVKADFNYQYNARHALTGGVSAIRYRLSPGDLAPLGGNSLITPNQVQQENALESAAYVGDNFEVSSKLSFYAGVRYSFYQYLGAKDVLQYQEGQPRDTSTIVNSVHYGPGKTIANYGGLEPRVSARYLLNENSSIKFSYNRMRQYIQMLSNTTVISPIDIWKLSDSYIKPQVGDQVSIGYYRNLNKNLIELSIEGYYKTIQNTVDYKSGALLLLNHHIETDILNADGKAYGVEFLLKKPNGKINGWVSYTYSRSFLRTVGVTAAETINHGNYYPSNYDKPHAFNFIGNYKFSRRLNFSLNAIYSTGRPITLPIAVYNLEGADRVYYSDRNQFRIPDYLRFDLSVNVEGNHKIKKLAHSSWTFAIYNVLGRHNVYSIYFASQSTYINGYQMSIFARPIPTITYNFKF
ncbi:MAG TPA: TonB-dependent receptor [Cyclobacteriaceae bacterium]|nr:TonB-dependent receptor [Cyclobacteriaceae bacterium]